ncbi:MAG: hypothetical protein IJ410_03785 [Oscillospiraceae bacterium]|nr:hypothetical protein [Oscillospiraceae bacterium]
MLQFLSIFSMNSWFVWPFIFVFSFAHGIKETIKGSQEFNWLLLFAGVSLMMMFAGLYY